MDNLQAQSANDQIVTNTGKVVLRAEELAFGTEKNTENETSNPIISKIKDTWDTASRLGPLTNIEVGDSLLDGRTVFIDSNPVLKFGSCAYLGLEFEPDLRSEAQVCLTKFGTQFSSSPTYLVLSQYNTLK